MPLKLDREIDRLASLGRLADRWAVERIAGPAEMCCGRGKQLRGSAAAGAVTSAVVDSKRSEHAQAGYVLPHQRQLGQQLVLQVSATREGKGWFARNNAQRDSNLTTQASSWRLPSSEIAAVGKQTHRLRIKLSQVGHCGSPLQVRLAGWRQRRQLNDGCAGDGCCCRRDLRAIECYIASKGHAGWRRRTANCPHCRAAQPHCAYGCGKQGLLGISQGGCGQ